MRIDPGIENLCRSNVFQLNSLKNDKSVLQESENSLRVPEEQSHPDGSLQSLVQPEFIKRIGVTKNG
eukprot:CAMPEP_0185599740 /NCGR_PEP_ID=MMETSP0434-20130131/82906_1 /TAXON_ID=626734 ORGANISM="Favella taraikaensis, Strain Fe Narragansett Bay" /NCGR_SAMPLE_ID=MMETSP0434 /ASSEMBLY_ACC=CAM_ASM_000379 /LENGTH=66 /DNA_ID=CAMNT_0028229241 /DNA_START=202 /DNA_END=402 /DNA_ORIENTATION=-